MKGNHSLLQTNFYKNKKINKNSKSNLNKIEQQEDANGQQREWANHAQQVDQSTDQHKGANQHQRGKRDRVKNALAVVGENVHDLLIFWNFLI